MPEDRLGGRAGRIAILVSYVIAAGVCAFLFIASIRFLDVEIDAGTTLGYGIPIWVFELVQPLGFGLITIRLLRHAAGGVTGFALAALAATVVVAAAVTLPLEPASLVAPALVCLLPGPKQV